MWQLSQGERKPVGLRRGSQAFRTSSNSAEGTGLERDSGGWGISPPTFTQLQLCGPSFLQERERERESEQLAARQANGAPCLPWPWEVKDTPPT